MEQSAQAPSRPRGRPARPEHELRDAALRAATWLLLNEGYAATTMEAVAKHAGVAKKSLYKYAANREELVTLVIRSWTDAFVPAFEVEVASAQQVLPALAEILQAMAARVLSADAVGMFRLLSTQFPAHAEMLAVYQRNGIERSTALLCEWFERQRDRGLVRVEDPRALCGLLLSMVIAEPLRQMALGLIAPAPQWDVAPRVQAALRLLGGQAFAVTAA
ncbi:TetR/AcrR family transcriptional regulator [Janthinobacterium fluminis]|uniref:TetR/AcrR family transcriptional regulator n=1 Tax=Janthinobacterium fluminis TaxID=2987524 RepID=A0ABT5K0N5_9BURK|nr:TetR/AcrR family transcriptional regulator [Janthinobacterium fluminis]MDC8757317.1 TetR/AcrR family transcriptional regulator [Janthinobacterium fluminis]